MSNTNIENNENKAAAALLSSGIGCLTLGICTVLGESSITIQKAMQWSNSVGPLSGKVGIAVIVWIISWIVLHNFFVKKPSMIKKMYKLSLILIALGFLFTFPPFFKLFG
jgi:hypothetical protein